MASFSAFSLALLLRLAQSGAAAESGKSVPSARISSRDRISLFSFSGWASSLRKTFLSITAWQRQRAGEERRGRAESVARLSLHWAYLLWRGKLGHLPKELLQLMAGPAESRPKASTAPASPPALPGTRLKSLLSWQEPHRCRTSGGILWEQRLVSCTWLKTSSATREGQGASGQALGTPTTAATWEGSCLELLEAPPLDSHSKQSGKARAARHSTRPVRAGSSTARTALQSHWSSWAIK